MSNEPTNKHYCGGRIKLLRRQWVFLFKERIARIVRTVADGLALQLEPTSNGAYTAKGRHRKVQHV